jgi:nuclear transport factor 2 (NTF2) superfamily protein
MPPFNEETARQKVKAAEDAWNTRDPERVALAYTENSQWRNRDEFFEGREAIKDFLRRKWARELDYRLGKEMWCYTANRIAVRFEYESHDADGQWWRSHGNELWEFDENGLMKRRDASINDYKIDESYRFRIDTPLLLGCTGPPVVERVRTDEIGLLQERYAAFDEHFFELIEVLKEAVGHRFVC